MLYVDTSVCLEVSISNVIPESLDICPQLHLKQISQSSGITLPIHTPPDTDCISTCIYSSIKSLHGVYCRLPIIYQSCLTAWQS